jgi:hypothetical protein
MRRRGGGALARFAPTRRAPSAFAFAALAVLCVVAPRALASTGAPVDSSSRLAIPVLRGAAQVPELWLAQRTIEREWGLSEDSTYRTLEVKGWKYEGLALSLSGVVPGAGQLYVGENSGWAFLLGEALGWVGRTVTRRRGDDLRDQAATFVGDPTDPASPWSFERYAASTGDNADFLRTLWAQDRDAFYEALSNDARYRFGFSNADVSTAYESYHDVHESSQKRYRQARYLEIALWANHAVAAFDALRAARLHNLPLKRNLDLQLGGRMNSGKPTLRAALVRRF